MNEFTRRSAGALVVGMAMLGIVVCLISIVGGLFYLADNTAWFFVPPIVAIALLFVASRPRTTTSSLVVYSLVALFVASYVVENWRWALERAQIGGFYMAPDIAAIVLVVIALWAFHRRRAN